MKSLITVLFVIFAVSQAEAASKSYSSLTKNDDGSYSIVEPYFSSAEGEGRYLSQRSNPTGVCKLFGFERYIESSLVGNGDLGAKTVIINAQGKFGGYYSYNSSSSNGMIMSIICADDDTTAEPSEHYAKKTDNDDGSTTIVEPYFASATGKGLYLSARSDLEGVCALYGFSSYVGNSLVAGGDLGAPTVIIGGTGSFAGYFRYNSSKSNTMIKSIICE